MSAIPPLLAVADAYGAALGLPDKTISSRVFSDSKKLTALRNGADITTGRLATALQWFSDHWPDGVAWPSDVQRPCEAA